MCHKKFQYVYMNNYYCDHLAIIYMSTDQVITVIKKISSQYTLYANPKAGPSFMAISLMA